VDTVNAYFTGAFRQVEKSKMGRRLGRIHHSDHAYWREGGPEFATSTDRPLLTVPQALVLSTKTASTGYLDPEIAFRFRHNCSGGRSEVKRSGNISSRVQAVGETVSDCRSEVETCRREGRSRARTDPGAEGAPARGSRKRTSGKWGSW